MQPQQFENLSRKKTKMVKRKATVENDGADSKKKKSVEQMEE